MNALEVLEAGPYTTVQDRGRFGGQRYGLGTAGAMDLHSLAVANSLVGNPVFAAGVEIGPLPARFRAVGGPVRLALAGAVRGMTIGTRAINGQETFLLADEEILTIRASSDGVFSTLAIEGGIAVEPVFGSLSMHARSGIGAPYPRALGAGDRLPVRAAGAWDAERNLKLPPRDKGPIRVVLGPQADHFSGEAIEAFLTTEWGISPTSDRMGYRLEGPPLEHAKGYNIISDGIANGSVQIPGNGQPLVLLADRGTTGGYPKIATIITPDLGRLAQIAVGAKVRFAALPISEAQALTRQYFTALDALGAGVRMIGGGDLSSEFLLAANLAGAAISGDEF